MAPKLDKTPGKRTPVTPPKPAKPVKPNPNAANSSAHGIIVSMLHEFGLDGLAGWAWNRFKETGSTELVHLEMEDRPEYKKRFAGRLALRDQGVEMTEAGQIAWEKSAHDLMRAAGMPAEFYDNPSDFTDLIAGGVGVDELGTRINDAFVQVSKAPPEVRRTMAEYYGAGSDSALAALALDTKKAAPAIARQVAAAETGGLLSVQGINLGKSLAESLAAAAGHDTARIQQAAQQTGQWNAQGVFEARLGEDGATTLADGLDATFGQDQRAVQKLSEQEDQRAASGQGSSFGPGGLGTSQR